jgi:hypothetical protein
VRGQTPPFHDVVDGERHHQGGQGREKTDLYHNPQAKQGSRQRERPVRVERGTPSRAFHEALEGGDFIENAEYEAAKNEQAFVEGRIQELELLK